MEGMISIIPRLAAPPAVAPAQSPATDSEVFQTHMAELEDNVLRTQQQLQKCDKDIATYSQARIRDAKLGKASMWVMVGGIFTVAGTTLPLLRGVGVAAAAAGFLGIAGFGLHMFDREAKHAREVQNRLNVEQRADLAQKMVSDAADLYKMYQAVQNPDRAPRVIIAESDSAVVVNGIRLERNQPKR